LAGAIEVLEMPVTIPPDLGCAAEVLSELRDRAFADPDAASERVGCSSLSFEMARRRAVGAAPVNVADALGR
jgi:hypothetical protein